MSTSRRSILAAAGAGLASLGSAGARGRAGARETLVTEGATMQLLKGINHVAIVTANLDRFIEFYTRVFEIEVVFSESTPAFRHAILRTGPDSWLHPAEIAGNSHAAAIPTMFTRGHIDHLSLTAASREAFAALCARLVKCGACSGVVEDLGAFHAIWFEDPDGMRAELTVIVDPELAGIHEARRIDA